MKGKRKERCDGVRTREAILVAAEEEFAERGFAAASTRAICARAGANNALVNRYYGTKENLYRIVAKHLFGDLGAPLVNLDANVDSEEAWRAAVREWVEDMLFMTLPRAVPQRRCAALFRHEVTHPTKFHDEFKRDFGDPVAHALERLVAMATEDRQEISLWVSTIWAQVSVYALADPVWHAAFRPKGVSAEEWAARVRDHICEDVFARLRFKGAKRVTAP